MLQIRRSFDASEVNPIINHPAVLPMIGFPGTKDLDLAPLLADANNIVLTMEGGAILFAHDEPGIYEVHTNFMPDFRGKYAIEASKEAYKWMFLSTDAMLLQTKIPAVNRAAKLAARVAGWEKAFTREGIWPTKDGGSVDVTYYALAYADWVKTADGLVEAGKAFHDRLDAEYIRHKRAPHTHKDEECHDRYVGACVEMIYAGQPEKAIVLYNRWARFSGYQQIALTSRQPVVIDMGEAVLLVQDRNFKVIKCRPVH